ncbi:MAG: DUF3999 family protein [Parcubacteria group bacterium]|jgi:hypothetical protein
MKKSILICALFFSIISTGCLADFDLTRWKYYKDISSSGGDMAKITLDDEVFSGATKDLSDLRIIDGNNQEVPFQLVSAKERSKVDRTSVTMINNSFVPGENSQVVLDLGTSGNLVNNLRINTVSENFQRNVKVYGGNDMQAWNTLIDNGYIYDFTDKKANFKSQNTEIYFPNSAYRYIKIEITDENGSPVKINSVDTSNIVQEKTRGNERRPQFKSLEKSDEKLTELVADLGASGIPTDRLSLDTNNMNFNRAILVYASNDENARDWNYLGQGYVFRYSTPKFNGENLTVNFPETNKRLIRIEVINKDDVPLSISALRTFSIYREVIFETKATEKYRLFYGNAKANHPQYDLEKYFQYLEPDKAAQASLGGQKDSPGFVPEQEPLKPLTERIPYLLSGIMTVTSLLLIFLVYKFLKK